MNIVAKISFVLATVFYLPLYVLSFLYLTTAGLLVKSSVKKYGLPGGRRFSWALHLRKLATIMLRETSIDVLTYSTQIQKEHIVKAIDSKTPHKYICKDDRKLKPEEQTVFMVKFLDPWLEAKLNDEIYQVSGSGKERREQFLTGTQQQEVLKNCLVGWENFNDHDGKPVQFVSDMMENLSRLPPDARRELAEHIRGQAELTEGEG